MPFGPGLVLTLVVLPALLGGEMKDDVVAVVLSCFGFCVLSEPADESDLVEHGVVSFWFVPLSAVHAYPTGVSRDPLPRRLDGICGRGPKLVLGKESTPRRGAIADFGKESVRPKGGGVLSAAR